MLQQILRQKNKNILTFGLLWSVEAPQAFWAFRHANTYVQETVSVQMFLKSTVKQISINQFIKQVLIEFIGILMLNSTGLLNSGFGLVRRC